MPMSGRTTSGGTSRPNSRRASLQERACASLESISVPSTSSRTPASVRFVESVMTDRSIQVRGRALLGLWIGAVIVVSIQAAAHHNNNFEIFRTSWLNLLTGTDLYGPSPRHADFFKYSPTFAMLF